MGQVKFSLVLKLTFLTTAFGFPSSNNGLDIFRHCNFYFIPTMDVSKEIFLKMPQFFNKLLQDSNYVPIIIPTIQHNSSTLLRTNKHWGNYRLSRLNRYDTRIRIAFIDIKEAEIIQKQSGYRFLIRVVAQYINPKYIFAHAKSPYNRMPYSHQAFSQRPWKLVVWSSVEKYKDVWFIPCLACNNLAAIVKSKNVNSLIELDNLWYFYNNNMQARFVVKQDAVNYERNGK
jgi:hypothetical protein